MELNPKRRRRALIGFIVACVGCTALAVMNAIEPYIFEGRPWNVAKLITVIGLCGGSLLFGWLAWLVLGKPNA